MTYDEIYDNVVALTGRPDLTVETQLAICSVTTELHSMDFWKRDHVDQFVSFPSSASEQSFSLSSLARFRIFSYIRKWDPTAINQSTNAATGWVGSDFTIVEPDKILDDFKIISDDKFYISNDSVILRSWTPFQHLLIGYYRLPKLLPVETFSSWIADMWPYAIINGAAAEIAGDVGNTEMANRLSAKAAKQALLIAPNSLEALAR